MFSALSYFMLDNQDLFSSVGTAFAESLLQPGESVFKSISSARGNIEDLMKERIQVRKEETWSDQLEDIKQYKFKKRMRTWKVIPFQWGELIVFTTDTVDWNCPRPPKSSPSRVTSLGSSTTECQPSPSNTRE